MTLRTAIEGNHSDDLSLYYACMILKCPVIYVIQFMFRTYIRILYLLIIYIYNYTYIFMHLCVCAPSLMFLCTI